MSLTKYKFGDLIELCCTYNCSGSYGDYDAIGVNTNDKVRIMKGNAYRNELSDFIFIKPGVFIYDPMRIGRHSLVYNRFEKTFKNSFNNMSFKIKDNANGIVLPEYLFLYFSRKEWAAKTGLLSFDGSTESFTWNELCESEICLPSLLIQQKYVDFYNLLEKNQRIYELGLNDLKNSYVGYIKELGKYFPPEKIGEHLVLSNERNSNGLSPDAIRSIDGSNKFIKMNEDADGINTENLKIVPPGYIACISVNSNLGGKIAFAHNDSDDTYMVSEKALVFTGKSEVLLPEYLMLFLNLPQFVSRANKEAFEWPGICDIRIPIPYLELQSAIADVYNVYIARKEIDMKLKKQINEMCSMLIEGSRKEKTR